MAKARVERRGDVAEIVLDGPPLNLFDAEMVTDLEVAVEAVRASIVGEGVRAMLLRAEGKVFCAGVDVHEFQGLTQSGGALLMSRYLALSALIESLPVPTLAVVHSLNLTIGLEMSLACDMMWAGERASFGLVEPTVGLTPGAGGTQRMVARAGVARAAEFVMTGDIYPAAEMMTWGVVNRVRPNDSLLVDARAFIDRLAAGPTVATAAGKRLLLAARNYGTVSADAQTAVLTGAAFATRDVPHGLASLLEHGPRKAVFEGR